MPGKMYKILLFILVLPFCYAQICDNPEPEWLWCDDFETGDYQSRYGDYDDGGDYQLSTDAYSGTYAYEMRYSVGQENSAYLGWWFCDRWNGITEPCQDEIYYRWYHKYEAGFLRKWPGFAENLPIPGVTLSMVRCSG